MSTKYKLFTLESIPTPIFTMTPLELKEYIDFNVKRIYFISSPEVGKPTGSHCHYREDELFVMVSGSCIIMVDDGNGIKEIKLVGPSSAIFTPHLVWHGFKDMTSDAIICALSSTNYSTNRSDYCEDYKEFQKLTTI